MTATLFVSSTELGILLSIRPRHSERLVARSVLITPITVSSIRNFCIATKCSCRVPH